MNTKELVLALKETRDALLIVQREEILPVIPEKIQYRCSRNHWPHGGWGVPGNNKWTRAMHLAECPTDNFWSGSHPTPSTQYPLAFIRFLESIDK